MVLLIAQRSIHQRFLVVGGFRSLQRNFISNHALVHHFEITGWQVGKHGLSYHCESFYPVNRKFLDVFLDACRLRAHGIFSWWTAECISVIAGWPQMQGLFTHTHKSDMSKMVASVSILRLAQIIGRNL